MLDLIQSFILGLVQGLAEFLPISSSGHLQWIQHFFGTHDIFFFIIAVHFGTWFSLLVFYRSTLKYILKTICHPLERNIFFKIFLASIPAVLVGLFLLPIIEDFFKELHWSALGFILTGLCLLGTYFLSQKKFQNPLSKEDFYFQTKELQRVSFIQAIIMGISQSLALFPGVSRAGWTMASGIYMGLHPRTSLNFSFMMGFVILFGACIVEFSITSWEQVQWLSLLIGFMTSFIFGLLSLHMMKAWILHLYKFSFYLLMIGLLCLLYLFLNL